MSSSTGSGSPLSSETLTQLRQFWFKGQPKKLTDEEPAIKECMQRWYKGGGHVDNVCRRDYLPALQEAEKHSVQQLAERFQTPEDALGLMILLDQIPRNVYRGKEAKRAYAQVDPKARDLSKTFISDPNNFDRKELWDNWWYRSFFYMPLMHSESFEDHDLILKKIDAAIADADSEAEKKAMGLTRDFEVAHGDVVRQFGRYPSRNEAMERESTAEEQEFLKSGAGW